MTIQRKHQLFTVFIALVWLVNGLICKVLNFVPRHQQIVATILGNDHSGTLTLLIGLAETVMAIWIISGRFSRINAVLQIIIIAVMNSLEFILVPDLLLWGKANAVFAFLFILFIYYTEFNLNKKLAAQGLCCRN